MIGCKRCWTCGDGVRAAIRGVHPAHMLLAILGCGGEAACLAKYSHVVKSPRATAFLSTWVYVSLLQALT